MYESFFSRKKLLIAASASLLLLAYILSISSQTLASTPTVITDKRGKAALLVLALSSVLIAFSITDNNRTAFGQPADEGNTVIDYSYALKVDGEQYFIRYFVYGGASIQNMTIDKNAKSLVVVLTQMGNTFSYRHR